MATYTFSPNTRIKSNEVNMNFAENPGMYKAPTVWVPTHTGFSVNPTVVAYYAQIGKTVDIWYNTTGAGTSNAVTFTITNLPATPNISQVFATGRVLDNGANLTVGGRCDIAASSDTLTLYKTTEGVNNWTASGSKAAFFHIRFTIA